MIGSSRCAGILTAAVLACAAGACHAPPPPDKTARAARASFAVWSSYAGSVESRNLRLIMSRFRGTATVVELAPEGAPVARGDVLVRFDSAALEREILKLERERTEARAERDGLVNAKQPLELREPEMKLLEARATLGDEQRYLEASEELLKEGLVSAPEIEQQKAKIVKIRTQIESLEEQRRLIAGHQHPAELARANARVGAAEQELALAREQLASCVLTAPAAGVVVHKQIPLGTEFRSVRIGDSIYPNQAFLILTDLEDLVAQTEIPEAEISRVRAGDAVLVEPLSYPGLRIDGAVEQVAALAQSPAQSPGWQKFFHAVIGIRGADPRLRPGMSVTVHVLTYRNPDALLIPRSAVRRIEGAPFATVVRGGARENRQLTLGMADEKNYEVLAGLAPGDEVLLE